MWFWILGWVLMDRGVHDLHPLWQRLRGGWASGSLAREFRSAALTTRTLREMLESGVLPSPEDWKSVARFPVPWGALLSSVLADLRAQGSPVLPTLRRVEESLIAQADGLLEARARSAQALGQALLGVGLVPLFGAVLGWLMPGMDASDSDFALWVSAGSVYASFSAVWILNLSEEARFGGLPPNRRTWLFSVPAALERILSLISGGLPPDLAWKKCHEELCLRDPGLAHLWGTDLWEASAPISSAESGPIQNLVAGTGMEVKKTIQLALLEGRSSRDRLESLARGFQKDLQLRVRERLETLPQRCLKPLFLFVFPPVFILLAVAVLQAFQELES
jgi:hypothetical protein